MEIHLIAHNIRSLHNIGSLFRTADGAGVTKIYLTGYTAAPIDKFKRPVREIAKVALGAEESIPWEKTRDLGLLITRLKAKNGLTVTALEQAPGAISVFDNRAIKAALRGSGGVAVVLGNEVRGLSPGIIKKCDYALEIPMFGKKESLNVVIAAGITLFKLREIIFNFNK